MSDPEAQSYGNCSEYWEKYSASYHASRINVCHYETALTEGFEKLGEYLVFILAIESRRKRPNNLEVGTGC